MKNKKRGLIILSIPLVLVLCLLFIPAAKSFNLNVGPIGDLLPKFMTEIGNSASASAIAKVVHRVVSGRGSQPDVNEGATANLGMPDGMKIDDFVRTYSPTSTDYAQGAPAGVRETSGQPGSGLASSSGSGFQGSAGGGSYGSGGSAGGGGSYGSGGGQGSGASYGSGGSVGAGGSSAGGGNAANPQMANSSSAGATTNSGSAGSDADLAAQNGKPGKSQPGQSGNSYFPPTNTTIGPGLSSSPSRWEGGGIPDDLKKYGSDTEREYPHNFTGSGSSPLSDPGLIPELGSVSPLSNTGFPGKGPLGDVSSGGMNPAGAGLNGPSGPIEPSLTLAPAPAVPEPATLALLGSGLAGLYFLSRRRKR